MESLRAQIAAHQDKGGESSSTKEQEVKDLTLLRTRRGGEAAPFAFTPRDPMSGHKRGKYVSRNKCNINVPYFTNLSQRC